MSAPERTASGVRRLGQFLRAVAERFDHDRCLLRASALTYTSLLSLVPLLALMFAVLKGLGIQRRLEPFLLERLGIGPDATQQVLSYIDHTNVGTLGVLGAAALITTVISVLGTIEQSFNDIWRVRHGRTWWRKATDYLSTVLLTPFLLLAAVALTSSLQEQTVLRWILQTEYLGDVTLYLLRLAPIGINIVALAILYIVMPNRRPDVPSIAFGALVAGCLWQLVQWGYVALQIGVANYNAIYGALAQLPVTLVGIYLSWVVVLAGAELAAVYEFGAGADATSRGTSSELALTLHLLLRAADHFHSGRGPINPQQIAREIKAYAGTAADLAERLCEAGIFVATDHGDGTYVLARNPATVDLKILDELLDDHAIPHGSDQRVSALLTELRAAREADLRHRTLADLAGRIDPTRTNS